MAKKSKYLYNSYGILLLRDFNYLYFKIINHLPLTKYDGFLLDIINEYDYICSEDNGGFYAKAREESID